MNQLMTLTLGLLVTNSLFATDLGLSVRCRGTLGHQTYEMGLFAHEKMTGGYNWVVRHNGPYPTVSVNLGTTELKNTYVSALKIALTERAYMTGDKALAVPLFHEAHEVKERGEVTVDFSDRTNIRAEIGGVKMKCQ